MQKDILAFLFVACPKVFTGVASTVFNMVLLSHVGPGQFGLYSLAVVIVMMADTTFGAAIDMGVIRLASRGSHATAQDSFARGQVEIAALLIKLMVCLVLGGIIIGCAEPLGQLVFHEQGHGPLIALIVVTATGLLILRSVLVSFQIAEKFILYGSFDFLHSLLKFGVGGLLVVLSDTSIQTLMMVFAAASTATSLLGMVFVLRTIRPDWKKLAPVAASVIGVVKIYFMTYAVTATISRLDVFMLNHLSSLGNVGLFSGAQIITLIPEMIGSYMAIVANPKVIPYCREGRFKPLYKRFQSGCLFAAVAIYALALGIEHGYGDSLFPKDYAKVSEIVLALLPGALVSMSVMPFTVPFLMFFRPRFFLLMDLVSLPFVVILYYFSIQYYGVFGAALATSVSRLIKALIAHFFVLRILSHDSFASSAIMTGKAI